MYIHADIGWNHKMTRMLDILEKFLNLHAYTYFRLDGATKVCLYKT